MIKVRLSLTTPDSAIFSAAARERIMRQEYGQAIFVIVEGIADTARVLAPVDRGILRGSIFTEVKPGTGRMLVQGLVATGKQAPYAPYVEYGTRPHWMPIKPLKAWAARVLHDESAAYMVQRSIAMRGTKPKPFFGPAIEEGRRDAPGIMRDAHHRVTQRLVQERV